MNKKEILKAIGKELGIVGKVVVVVGVTAVVSTALLNASKEGSKAAMESVGVIGRLIKELAKVA